MSRLGKKPIVVPPEVKLAINDQQVTLTGPKGTMERLFNPRVKVVMDEANKKVSVTCAGTTKFDKAIHGTERSLLNNMIIGVATGYEKKLEIHGVGYNAKQQGNELIITIGYSHPIKKQVPKGLAVTIPNPNMIVIQGVNKELVGSFADHLRAIKPCDPYQLKGIKYSDEVIRRKAGKTFVSGST